MITNIFSKSQPVNFVFIAILMMLCFALFQIQTETWNGLEIIITKIASFLLLVVTVLLTNFIGNKNNLQKNSAFSVLCFVLFIILLPDVFNNLNVLIANLLLLFAIRRLLSMQSQIDVKQKIFDASLLIFGATIFKFWAILFIVLVFASIVFHASRDYRNWIVPLIAIIASTIAFIFFALLIDNSIINIFWQSRFTSYNFDYFKNIFQNLSLSFYTSISVLFFATLLNFYAKKPLTSHPHYKILILTFFIGLLFYIVTPYKSNASLLITFAPTAIFAANYFDNIETVWVKEATAIVLILMSIFCFIGQIY